MSKITLRLETLAVESFEPAPGGGDVPFSPSALVVCDSLEAPCNPYTYDPWIETCAYQVSCQIFCAA